MYNQHTASTILEALEQGANQVTSRLTFSPLGRPLVRSSRALPTSLIKRDNQLILAMEVPGVTKDQIKIDVTESVLTVKIEEPSQNQSTPEEDNSGAETKDDFIFNERQQITGRERKFNLAKDLGVPTAEVKNGLLILTMEIKEPQSQTIDIN